MSNQPVNTVVHEYGVPCERCGGNGFRTDPEREQMPGCPMSLDFELPLGPEGLKLAKAREVFERRAAGVGVKEAREAAGLTQEQLAAKAGVSRSAVAMGERYGIWGKGALAKIRQALGHPVISSELRSTEAGMFADLARFQTTGGICSKAQIEQQVRAKRHKMALAGELGEYEKTKAEQHVWCAKVAERSIESVDQIERMLTGPFGGNKMALLAHLGLDSDGQLVLSSTP